MKRNESLISGPIGSALLAFVVPLMLSSLVQQLYVTADAVIVGRIAGKTALAAIDSVHTLFRFPINFMNGLAAGATILISRHFGAENRDGLRSCMLSAVAYIIFTSYYRAFTPCNYLKLESSPHPTGPKIPTNFIHTQNHLGILVF